MSEIMKPRSELWFEGPNYTADSVIIDENAQEILLVKRKDSGEWALPGGFLDNDESSFAAALREASEEAAVVLTQGQLVYRGIVDDPRNTERSWIETDAYLFSLSHETSALAGDDVEDAAWFSLGDTPPLYASHQAIIDRAVDYAKSRQQVAAIPLDAPLIAVDGGHMNYTKYMAVTAEHAVFVKQYEGESKDMHVATLEKEAAIMAHLRTAAYPHLPAFSHIADQGLFMEALPPDHGWHWRAPKSHIDAYVRDCLGMFTALESVQIPSDTTAIPSALSVYWDEGWKALDNERQQALTGLTRTMARFLRPDSQATASQLLDDIPLLRSAALQSPLPDSYAFCHHDARQANIAWHPDHGARLVDWSWADIGLPGSDATMLLIDLHKHGHDITPYIGEINPEHCAMLIGFWLEHALRPVSERDPSIRLQQYISALAAYEVLGACGSGV